MAARSRSVCASDNTPRPQPRLLLLSCEIGTCRSLQALDPSGPDYDAARDAVDQAAVRAAVRCWQRGWRCGGFQSSSANAATAFATPNPGPAPLSGDPDRGAEAGLCASGDEPLGTGARRDGVAPPLSLRSADWSTVGASGHRRERWRSFIATGRARLPVWQYQL